MQYLVIIEKSVHSYGTHVPDLPGCVVVGETKAEVHRMITETIQFHLEGLRRIWSCCAASIVNSSIH